jgi:short-subunit dehydrogenase
MRNNKMKKVKIILITGASSGIGWEILNDLRRQGHKVIGTSRNKSFVESNEDFVLLDLSNSTDIEKSVEEIHLQYGEIDVLINNAGYGLAGPIEETSVEEAQEQFDINFFSVIRMIKAILPSMRKRKKGLIINIGSVGGLIGMPFQAYYSSSKFALQGFIEALRIELSPFNIKATNILPGDIKTSFNKNRKVSQAFSDIYRENYDNAMAQYLKDELSGLPSSAVANVVSRIIDRSDKNPKVNYIVSNYLQKLFIFLKSIMSGRSYEWTLKILYKQV